MSPSDRQTIHQIRNTTRSGWQRISQSNMTSFQKREAIDALEAPRPFSDVVRIRDVCSTGTVSAETLSGCLGFFFGTTSVKIPPSVIKGVALASLRRGMTFSISGSGKWVLEESEHHSDYFGVYEIKTFELRD